MTDRPTSAALTPAQQVSLLAGVDMWHTAAIPEHDIPQMRVTDGPSGARGTVFTGGQKAINVPCGTALAATFDLDLVEQIGRVLGRETRSKGARVLLAPTVNLHRTPIGGRNFECFSEDPHLSSEMAVAYIRGVQSEGVACCVKHFVGNDSEIERMSVNSVIDEVTLHEMYLRPFEAAVTRAGVQSVMTGYNRLNGPFAADSRYLITEILRERWGFDGAVMSDWTGLHSTVEGIESGLDLEMPGPPLSRGQKLLEAMEAGEVDPALVRAAADRMLAFLDTVGALADGGPAEETTRHDDADNALVRRAGAASMVLLHNPVGVLPLDAASLTKVAVLGPNARIGQPMGGGSAHVDAVQVIHPLEGIRDALPGVEVVHADGAFINKRTPELALGSHSPVTVQYWRGTDGMDSGADWVHEESMETLRIMWQDEPPTPNPMEEGFSARITSTFTPDSTGTWTFGVTAVGNARLIVDGQLLVDNADAGLGDSFFGLGKSEQTGTIDLTEGQAVQLVTELRMHAPEVPLFGVYLGAVPPRPANPVEEAVRLAAESDVAIVVVGTNDDWESEGWDRPSLDLPGEQDRLIHEVAAVAQRTIVVVNAGSPVLMPWLEEVEAVLFTWFPGQAFGAALADVLLGDVEPTGRLPVTFPRSLEDTPAADHYPPVDGVMEYGEGRLIGHHWWSTLDKAPLFPFGAGLGYGDASITEARVDGEAVAVTVRNAADRVTSVVVQVYAHCLDEPPGDQGDLPDQRLAGFARITVPADGTAGGRVALDQRAMQRWDTDGQDWGPAGSRFELRVGFDATDAQHRLQHRPLFT